MISRRSMLIRGRGRIGAQGILQSLVERIQRLEYTPWSGMRYRLDDSGLPAFPLLSLS